MLYLFLALFCCLCVKNIKRTGVSNVPSSVHVAAVDDRVDVKQDVACLPRNTHIFMRRAAQRLWMRPAALAAHRRMARACGVARGMHVQPRRRQRGAGFAAGPRLCGAQKRWQWSSGRDPWSVLGVDRGADAKTVKKAFLKVRARARGCAGAI